VVVAAVVVAVVAQAQASHSTQKRCVVRSGSGHGYRLSSTGGAGAVRSVRSVAVQ
jgi:hypothetical protein